MTSQVIQPTEWLINSAEAIDWEIVDLPQERRGLPITQWMRQAR
jgi:hypothetical protein